MPPRKERPGFFLDSKSGVTSFHLIRSVFFVELLPECFHTGKKFTIKIASLPPRANVAAKKKEGGDLQLPLAVCALSN